MNKLTATLIIGLMSCALCGCMSEQEWKEWNQKRGQEHIEWRFSMRGVKYPGTREEYVASHSMWNKEDIVAIITANLRSFVGGSLDGDDIEVKTSQEDLRDMRLFIEKSDLHYEFLSIEESERLDFFRKHLSLEEGKEFDRAWKHLSSKEREEANHFVDDLYNKVNDNLVRYSNVFNQSILKEYFMRGMTLEQVRVTLQKPLSVEYVSLHSAMYSCDCKSPDYSTDCTINFTFFDGRLNDWTKIYLPHISEPTYVPPMYYYDADGELHIF